MPRHTLSETLNLQLDNYLAGHKLPYYQLKALNAYRACRTHQLGGHTQYCTNGHVMGVWHNSCKRRGCPRSLAINGVSSKKPCYWILLTIIGYLQFRMIFYRSGSSIDPTCRTDYLTLYPKL